MRTTNLKAAAGYIVGSSSFLLLVLLLIGCKTPEPPAPGDLKFPPVKYGSKPPLPQSESRVVWTISDYVPPSSVRIQWDYPAERSNILFRVYGSYTPYWDEDLVGWWVIGETKALSFSADTLADARFFTVTASNTLLGLESDPAERE